MSSIIISSIQDPVCYCSNAFNYRVRPPLDLELPPPEKPPPEDLELPPPEKPPLEERDEPLS